MEPGSTCWLSASVHVRVSEIDGTGLVAARPIAAGELVSRLGGRLVSTEQLHRLFEESREYGDTITVADDRHLVLGAGPRGVVAWFVHPTRGCTDWTRCTRVTSCRRSPPA